MNKQSVITVSFLVILLIASSLGAVEKNPPKPEERDKCPVCGMFVAKYPDFIAVITFIDGTRIYFDGVKDMMKCYFNLQKYYPSKRREDITRIHVTDYYSLKLVDGFKAFFVTGSEIYGPMGKELIPFEKEDEARGFMKDHQGETIYCFGNITHDIVKRLD